MIIAMTSLPATIFERITIFAGQGEWPKSLYMLPTIMIQKATSLLHPFDSFAHQYDHPRG